MDFWAIVLVYLLAFLDSFFLRYDAVATQAGRHCGKRELLLDRSLSLFDVFL